MIDKIILIAVGIFVLFLVLPILIFFCMKFGVIAFYKAKQYIEKEQTVKKEKGVLYEQKEER